MSVMQNASTPFLVTALLETESRNADVVSPPSLLLVSLSFPLPAPRFCHHPLHPHNNQDADTIIGLKLLSSSIS